MSGATSRRRFLRGVAGLSLGAMSLEVLVACQRRATRSTSKRLPLIGYLDGAGDQQEERANTAAVREGLAALGYREGQTVRIEWRYAGRDQSRWFELARELAGLHPDVFVVRPIPLVQYMHSITPTIPIVVVLQGSGPEDLIATGLITSQVRPGGNITGLVGSPPSLAGKRLDLLHEILPRATRLAVLEGDAPNDLYKPYPAWTSDAISLRVSRQDELDDAFVKFEEQHAELLAVDDRGSFGFPGQIAAQARLRRLPATSGPPAFAASGGLISYAADLPALYRGAGRFVDKILKGEKPADLPVELPTAFNFVINKGTANALGLTIPPAVLAQATEVLQ